MHTPRPSTVNRRLSTVMIAALIGATTPTPAHAANVRVKELVDIQGVRDNELFGYGLVVGLSQTGDSQRVLFTLQSIAGMLGRLGTRINPNDIRVRNVAAVMVTARLPTFARTGTKVDVTVGSLGDARSLQGGILLITPLTGADGKVYAVAQGPIQVGGFTASAAGSAETKNQTNSARIPFGAIVERAVIPNLTAGPLVLELKRPDFTNAMRIAKAINKALGDENAAKAIDPAAVEIAMSEKVKTDLIGSMSQIEAVEVDADMRAMIVVSERTGTVVAGDRVRIRPIAVAHGGLRVSIAQRPIISQPTAAFSNAGRTVVAAQADVRAGEENHKMVALPATTTVDDLVKALNLIGASPRDLISIIQAIKAAGALDADLEVI